jgi:hypothetical protein
MSLVEIQRWLADNREWVFSGVGVVVLAALVERILRPLTAKRSSKDALPGQMGNVIAKKSTLVGPIAGRDIIMSGPARGELRAEVDRSFHPLDTVEMVFGFKVNTQHRFHKDYFQVLRDTSLRLAEHYRQTGAANLFDGGVIVVGRVRSHSGEPWQPVHVIHSSKSPFLPGWDVPSGPAINLISFEVRFYCGGARVHSRTLPNPDLQYWVLATTQGKDPTVDIMYDLKTDTFSVSGRAMCEVRESSGRLLSFLDLESQALMVLHPDVRDDMQLKRLKFSSGSGLAYEVPPKALQSKIVGGRTVYMHQIGMIGFKPEG